MPQRWNDDWDDTRHDLDDDAVPFEPVPTFGTEDAARIGLDRNTVEGAQLAFFSRLDGRKPAHRLVAIVCLVALVGWPLYTTFERIMLALHH